MAAIRPRNGKYQALVRLKGHPHYVKTFKFHADAKRWADETERSLKLHGLPALRKVLENVTLEELIQRYIAERLPHKRSGSNEKVILQSFVTRMPALCKKSLAVITRQDFSNYRDERLVTCRTSTLRRELNPIRNMFNLARSEWNLPLDNPLKGLWLPPEPPSRDRRLRGDEENRLLQAVDGTRRNAWMLWANIIRLTLTTGMRRKELLSLRWPDIDFEKRTLTIRHSKNGRSRTLPLSVTAIEHLDGQQVFAIAESLERGFDPEGRVFNLTSSAFEQAWRRILKRAGIEGLTFHDLRHEAACRFEELGLTPSENSLMLGHAKKDMTSRYIHADLERIRKKLNEPEYLIRRTYAERSAAGLEIRGDEELSAQAQHAERALLKRHNYCLPKKGSVEFEALPLEERLAIIAYNVANKSNEDRAA